MAREIELVAFGLFCLVAEGIGTWLRRNEDEVRQVKDSEISIQICLLDIKNERSSFLLLDWRGGGSGGHDQSPSP